MLIQRASPNPATALGFYCCIGANVCVCVFVPTCFVVEGLVVCCSWMMFLGPLFGTYFSRFGSTSLRTKMPTRYQNLFEIIKDVPGSRPELQAEPLVPQMSPGLEHMLKLRLSRPLFWDRVWRTFCRTFGKDSFGFFLLFEVVSRAVFYRVLVIFGCVSFTFAAVVGE